MGKIRNMIEVIIITIIVIALVLFSVYFLYNEVFLKTYHYLKEILKKFIE